MQRIYLKDRSFSIDTLPSEAGLLVELLGLCRNEETGFDKFAFTIRRDSGLTAQFLRIANSPLYRQWNDVVELKRMLIVLGLQNVRKIIITSAVQNFFNKLSFSQNSSAYHFWLRALVCAHLAEALARKTGYPKTDEAYLGGLLHQIGIIMLLANYKDNYQEIFDLYDTTENYSELEQQNYGIDHCELGAALVETWHLDSLLADAILFQNAPAHELLNSPPLLKIVAVARALSSPPNTEACEQDIENAKLLLQLSQDATLECLASALDNSRKVLTELGFDVEESFIDPNETAKVETIRLQKAQELEEQIKNLTLSYCFMNGESQNTESLVKELRVSLALLFNLQQFVFLHQQQDRLIPYNDLKRGKLSEIYFTLNDQSSSVVRALSENKIYDSVSQPCTIADNQLIRIIDAECGYFLPLYNGAEQVGVMVIGCKRNDLAALREKLPLLQLLIKQIGKKYATFSAANEQEASISLTEFNKIVHEVKNPLTIINNYLYILSRKLDENHSAKEEIDFIKEEMERISAILAKARNREQPVDGTKNTDINRLLDELNSFFGNSLYNSKKIRCHLTLDPEIPELKYPENNLKQVFINIIKNAVEALPQAGEITITTRDNCFQDGNRFVEISLRDNGPGIPVRILQNLFQPVESTKKGHSGLGLSIVADLIKEMAGTISCYSGKGQGTEFKILLPRITTEH